uniref:G_PROTEIN_RECEP_F1_2 domain-containing protein n=1 Tax=Strongyloides papillosus TaxID=174720 RepID=A0A0N5CC43_STREA
MMALLKLPSWSIMPQFYLDNTYLAALSYLFGATTCCGPFIHTFFLSGLRYMAIYHPVKYTRISSPRTSIILCSLLLIISLSIGLLSLAYSSRYIYSNVTGITTPTYLDKSVAYYQFAYITFLYLPIIIMSAIFNVANFIGLSKTNKRNKNKKSETLFAIYSLFTYFTTCLMEAYLGSRIIGSFLGNQTIISIANYSLTWIGDLGTFGDFYFFIFINSEIRAAIKEIVCKYLNPRETMTAERYCKEKEETRKKLSVLKPALVNRRGPILLHDTAKLHVSKTTMQKLKELEYKTLPHSLYSPDLSSTDYHLFKELELHLRQKKFTKSNDLKNDVLDFLDSRDRSFFPNGINKLVSRWQQCADSNGTYFK